MSLTRRKAVLTGIGLLATGCVSTSTYRGPRRRGGASAEASWPWPDSDRLGPGGASTGTVAPHRVDHGSASPAPHHASHTLNIIPRARWTDTGPIRRKVNLMNGISKLTVHHEGWTPVYFTDVSTTAKRLEKIRKIHVRDRGWGDIGYHYVIDRAGRIWAARPRKFQGAHVRNHNKHNLGILCLGNFNKQNPSDAQLTTLVKALRTFQSAFDVPTSAVHSHGELVSTACPGRNLQKYMDTIRARLS